MTRAATKTAAPARPKKTGDELLEELDPQRRTADTWICLKADLMEEWQTEHEKLQAMRADELSKQSARLASAAGSSPEVKAQARKVQKLEKRINDSQMHFVFENLNPDEQAALAAEHPPRKGNQFDMMAGYNRDTMATASVRKCLVEPEFSDAGWTRLMGVIPPGEWNELIETCNRANGRVSSLPKSELAETLLHGRNGTASSSLESTG